MKNIITIKSALEAAGCEYRTDARFSALTSFHIGGGIPLLIMPDSLEKLRAAIAALQGEKFFVLGKGTNILAPDEGVDYAVITLMQGNFSSVEVNGERITVGAGASLTQLCMAALNAELTGLETEYGIPGSVGGGVFMNAGAYGGELKDHIESVTSLTRDGDIAVRGASELDMTYRHSIFTQNGEIVLSAVFKLDKGEYSAIRAGMDDYMSRRKDKQPLNFPSAGSVFRRPKDHFAGALIEQSGLKGFGIGGARVSEKHAGFIVNAGSATAADVKKLIEHIQKTVLENYGVALETEVLQLE